MLAGSSSQALGQTLAHQIERWPGFVQGRGFGELVIEHFVGMAMLEGKFEIGLAGLRQSAGVAKGSEKSYAATGCVEREEYRRDRDNARKRWEWWCRRPWRRRAW